MVAGAVVFGNLGAWQVRRLGEAEEAREAREARLEEPPFDAANPPEDPDRRRARLTGTPDWNRHVLLGGRYLEDRLGFDLLVPVHAGGRAVWVDFGWIPGEDFETVVARERAAAGGRTYEGLARTYPEVDAPAGRYRPETDGFQRFWAVMSPNAMSQGVDVAPFVLHDGVERPERGHLDTEPPIAEWDATVHARPHAEYAATWFGILGVLVALWAYGSVRSPPG